MKREGPPCRCRDGGREQGETDEVRASATTALAGDRGARRRQRAFLLLAPFLLAIASVLALMTRSLNRLTVAEVLPTLWGALAFSALVCLVVLAIRRRLDARTAVIATLWVAFALFHLSLVEGLGRLVGTDLEIIRSLAAQLPVLLALSYLAHRLPRPLAETAHLVLTGIACVLVIPPAWQVAAYQWRHAAVHAVYDPEQAAAGLVELAARLAPEAEDRPPDIYHFVFDRYTSEPVLAEHFGFDNSAIGLFLEERGFFVARDAFANHPRTAHSLAATFSMDYLDWLSGDPRIPGDGWHVPHAMLADHRVGRFLKAMGYELAQFGSWWNGTYWSRIADLNRPHGFSEFAMLYLRRTVARPIFHLLPRMPLTMRLDWDNAQCQRVAPQVAEIEALGDPAGAAPRDRPLYVFAHILVPHGPFNFTAEGGCLSQSESFARGEAQGYLDQIAYANRLIKGLVERLLAPERRPPVIIIQSDEGPFPRRQPGIPWQEASPAELQIKSGILNAFYFPDGDYQALHERISPVNTYRIVLNHLFGTDLPILPDKTLIFPDERNLYIFHDVTARLRGAD